MITRRYAILTLTRGALELGRRLSVLLPGADLYLNKRFEVSAECEHQIQQPLEALAADLFQRYDCLIWIMASGIVVRSIAPLLQHKASDPAVLVMDECGQFVISLLSGHLGRANDDAHKIAVLLGAEPVITTATDVTGSLAVDTLAIKLDCAIDDLGSAKRVTAEIVNGSQVGLAAPWPLGISLPGNIKQVQPGDDLRGCSGLIVISETPPVAEHTNQVWLIPRRIVAGVGCRRGKDSAEIFGAICAAMDEAGLDLRTLSSLASVDLKADEVGLIATAQLLNVPFHIVSRDDINRLDVEFSKSEFVNAAIGVAGVCEPVALLCSGGQLILPKRSDNGVTVALARVPEQKRKSTV